MVDWFSTSGRIVYDPPRGDMKTRVQWWCVITLDREITAYYRWFLRQHWWEVENRGMRRPYYQPAWDAHVSVVRGEKPKNPEAWKRWNGKEVELFYSNNIRQTGDTTGFDRPDHFWFVETKCPMVWKIREELGLPIADPKGKPFTLHLTIARAYH